jgi:ribosomal protein S18 acetylase RimI-like enzyme
MSLRRAEPSDARCIAEVQVSAWRAAYRGILPDSLLNGLSVADREKRWRERLTSDWGQFLVSEHNSAVVGFVGFGATRDEDANQLGVGEVYVLYVRPNRWRRGHGRSLLTESMASLREQGFREVLVWVLRDNQRAIDFYVAQGFAADGASKTKVRMDGTEIHLARYRRPI